MIQSSQIHSLEELSGRNDRDLAKAIAALHAHGPTLICSLWARIERLERRVTCRSRNPKPSENLAKQLTDALRESS